MRLELIKPPAERETLRKTNYYEVEVSLVPGGVYEKWSRNEHYIIIAAENFVEAFRLHAIEMIEAPDLRV